MTKRLTAVAFIVGIASILPQAARAQTCAGAASFHSGPIRLGAGLNVGDGVKSYGAQVAAGASVGVFGTAGVSRAEYDELSDAGIVLNFEGGYAVDLTPSKNVQFCPIASFAYQSGPNVGTIESSAHAFGAGGSIGGRVAMSPTLDFVPFGSASFIASRGSARAGSQSISVDESYMQLGFGAGFVLNHMLTLQPAVAFPVGLDGGKASFQLAFSFNLGSKR